MVSATTGALSGALASPGRSPWASTGADFCFGPAEAEKGSPPGPPGAHSHPQPWSA